MLLIGGDKGISGEGHRAGTGILARLSGGDKHGALGKVVRAMEVKESRQGTLNRLLKPFHSS